MSQTARVHITDQHLVFFGTIVQLYARHEVLMQEIMATVRSPDHRRPDPRPRRERYYSRNLGPSHWLFVVVQFDETPARIVTAYANRKDPAGLTTP